MHCYIRFQGFDHVEIISTDWIICIRCVNVFLPSLWILVRDALSSEASACEILNSQLSDDFKKLPTFTSYYVSPLLRMNRYIGRQALNKTYPQSETLKDFASCITCLRLLIITLRMCVPYSVFTFDCNILTMISTRDLITNFRLITSFTSIDCQPQPNPIPIVLSNLISIN